MVGCDLVVAISSHADMTHREVPCRERSSKTMEIE